MYVFECPKKVIEQFKRLAKKAFPSETLAYLLGDIEENFITVDDIWVPDNVSKYCNKDTVYIQPEWAIEAIEYAKDNDLSVIGDVHSHPITQKDLKLGVTCTHAQSEDDIDSHGMAWQQISGVCVVKECKSGRLTSSVRFWGPTVPLDVRIQ